MRDEIKKNHNILDKNLALASVLDTMDNHFKQKLIQEGGIPITGISIPKKIDTPTLLVYQTSIKKLRRGQLRSRYPMQKEENDVLNRVFNSFAPFTWFSVKRNTSNNTPKIDSKGIAKRNTTLIGGIALLFGFVIFTSLLVNQYNVDIKEAEPEKLKSIFINQTSYYLYSIIFVGVALLLFACHHLFIFICQSVQEMSHTTSKQSCQIFYGRHVAVIRPSS